MSKIKQLATESLETLVELFGDPSTQERVTEWNRIAGKEAPLKGSLVWYEVIRKQAERLQEEVTELLDDGINDRNLNEILDATVDIDYVLKGLISMLQMDVEGAVEAVCDNNDLKFLDNHQDALVNLAYWESRGEHCYIHNDVLTGKFAIKRVSDDKVMKPASHPKVDLTEFL